MNSNNEEKIRIRKISSFFILIAFFLIIFFNIFVSIPEGYRGVKTTFGKASDISYEPGLQVKFPFVQKIVKMPVQTLKYSNSEASASKDLQTVTTEITLNYRVSPESIPELYSTVGVLYQDKIIRPLMSEVVKSVTAGYTAEQLISLRPEVKEKITFQLQEKLSNRNLLVEEITITNFEFSESFNAAIEAKQVAEQDALKAERDLQRIEIEAEQKIALAKAEAESIRIQSEALSASKDVLELRVIEKWDGVLPVVTGGATPLVDISNFLPEVE